jgi:lipopolysaccharide export system protein LptC
MKSRVSHLLPIILMLLLGAMTLWLRVAIEATPSVDPGRNRHDPDAIVEKVQTVKLDERGRPQYRLSAQRLLHYPDNDSMELIEPRFTRSDANAALTVTAKRGTLNQDQKEGQFYGDVDLKREPRNGKDTMRVQTQYMQILMDREIARTDRAVTVSQGPSTLSGVGLEYDRRSGTLALLSEVKGSFHANKR